MKLDLPKDFQLPQGVEFKLDNSKPEFGKFQEIAVRRGLDQDTVTELMGVYAETLVGSEAALAKAKAAEVAKLGANGTARIDALNTFLTAQVGADAAKHLRGMMVTASIVQAFESLVAKTASQGAARFTPQHRDPAPSQMTDERWKSMTPAQRLDYNRQFDQSNMPAWKDPRAA